jgi:hypothetical protein
MNTSDRSQASADGKEQTKEKPTTSSGDALDDTGQDNQRKKEQPASKGAETDEKGGS